MAQWQCNKQSSKIFTCCLLGRSRENISPHVSWGIFASVSPQRIPQWLFSPWIPNRDTKERSNKTKIDYGVTFLFRLHENCFRRTFFILLLHNLVLHYKRPEVGGIFSFRWRHSACRSVLWYEHHLHSHTHTPICSEI